MNEQHWTKDGSYETDKNGEEAMDQHHSNWGWWSCENATFINTIYCIYKQDQRHYEQYNITQSTEQWKLGILDKNGDLITSNEKRKMETTPQWGTKLRKNQQPDEIISENSRTIFNGNQKCDTKTQK